MDAHVLVDFDNLIPPYRTMTLSGLAQRLRRTIDSQIGTVNELFVRLYGGWYGSMGLTNRGTRLAQQIQSDFPLVQLSSTGVISHTFCEIASSLIESQGHVLQDTFRERPGIRSRLTYVPHAQCAQGFGCTARDVVRWSQGNCPTAGCQLGPEHVFKYYEQKLVDTLLCCDLISLANRAGADAICVVSDDDDMTPAFLLAGLKSSNVWQLQMRSTNRRYALVMQQHNVRATAL